MKSKRRGFKRHNRTKRGGMDKLIRSVFKQPVSQTNESHINELYDKSETHDLENQAMRTKQDAVVNMVAELDKRVGQGLPDNMAMFAGPQKNSYIGGILFPYGSTSDNFYDIPTTLSVKNLLKFPRVKDFDILRFVYIGGGKIVDEELNIEIERRPAPYNNIRNEGNLTTSFKDPFIATTEWADIAYFSETNLDNMNKLYETYPKLFKNPELVTVGKFDGKRIVNQYGNIIPSIVGKQLILYPFDYKENAFYQDFYNKLNEQAIRGSHQANIELIK